MSFRSVAVALTSALVLSATVPASAAIVKNGNFESGKLTGWKQEHNFGGRWKVFEDGDSSCGQLLSTIAGTYSAVTDQGDPSRQVLYQDVQLPDARRLTLKLKLAYLSAAPINAAGSLSGNVSNQQLRVDVLRAGSSPFTMAPSKILATPFATQDGDFASVGPTSVEANLSKLRGQEVRLRIAVVATDACLVAIADVVKIKTA